MKILEISKGISHIEDLPIDEFVSLLEDFHQHEVTEKVDGAEIIFGIDSKGFYTSRELKGGGRKYCVEDYELTFPSTYMRSAHTLLEAALPILKSAGLRCGDQVEAEVLYGELPNVVPYSADRNYLIFLRTTEGSVNIDRLGQELDGKALSITLDTPYTTDGRTIQLSEQENVWKFSRVPVRECPDMSGTLSNHLNRLKSFLSSVDVDTDQTYKTILNTPLNKIPTWANKDDWKYLKEHLKEQREYIGNLLMQSHILPIKEVLLNILVRNTKSEYGPLVEDGGWIEGVVLKNKTTGRMAKLVDKDVFGTVRTLAWDTRNSLIEHAKSVDGSAGFVGRLLLNMATALGHPELGTIQAKKYLNRAGIISVDTLHAICENSDFDSVKSYWLNLFEIKTEELEKELDKYSRNTEILNESQLLTKAVRKRTLETFASAFDKIEQFKLLTEGADNISDLFMILIGKHLGT